MSPVATTKRTPKSQPVGVVLSERAMLVNLRIGFWEGRKMDKHITGQVVVKNGAKGDAGAWWTRLIPRKALGTMVTASNEGRHLHYRMTLPWNDQGGRVLPSAAFLDFMGQMRKIKEAFEAGRDEFLAEYPKLVESARERLGALYHGQDFPSVAELRSKFSLDILVSPLPDARDFRVDLGAEATDDIKRNIEQQTKELMNEAMKDLWERLYATVQRLAEKLGDTDGIFRDSMIEHLNSLCELMPKLNVTQDTRLEEMRQAVMAKFAKVDPEVLRKNKATRADHAKAAVDILKKMDSYMKKH